MTPQQAAYQLTKVWRASRELALYYPVNCRLIASELRAQVIEEEMSEKFAAALISVDRKRVILVNKSIREERKKNFCIAHELGHLSLHNNQPELHCRFEDLSDTAPHSKEIEQEANCFATNLLMPADDFREQINRTPGDLTIVKDLTDRYETTLTTTALRFVELATDMKVTVALVRDGVTKWSRSGGGGGWTIERGRAIALPRADSLAAQEVDLSDWYTPAYPTLDRLYLSYVFMEYYNQHLCLLWRR